MFNDHKIDHYIVFTICKMQTCLGHTQEDVRPSAATVQDTRGLTLSLGHRLHGKMKI